MVSPILSTLWEQSPADGVCGPWRLAARLARRVIGGVSATSAETHGDPRHRPEQKAAAQPADPKKRWSATVSHTEVRQRESILSLRAALSKMLAGLLALAVHHEH